MRSCLLLNTVAFASVTDAEQTQSKSLQTRCLQTRLQTSLCALADMSAVFATFNHANTSVRPILYIGEYSLAALQYRQIRYIGLRVSADANRCSDNDQQ